MTTTTLSDLDALRRYGDAGPQAVTLSKTADLKARSKLVYEWTKTGVIDFGRFQSFLEDFLTPDLLFRQHTHTNDDPRLKRLFALVEATNEEQSQLWTRYSRKAADSGYGPRESPRLAWEEDLSGFGMQVGMVGDMPVFVSLSFAKVEGELIGFYDATSQVVDHRMVRAWLDANATTVDGLPVPHNNATNFFNTVHDIHRHQEACKQAQADTAEVAH